MEIMDIYNINREKLGYTKIRGCTLNANEYNQGAEIWIFIKNKLLITKRAKNKSHPGKWEVTGGGSITKETSIDTILREVKEEIGITLKKENIFFLDTSLFKNQFVDIFTANINIDLKEIKLQLDEVDEYKLVTKNEFIKMNEEEKIVNSVFNRFIQIKDKIERNWQND